MADLKATLRERVEDLKSFIASRERNISSYQKSCIEADKEITKFELEIIQCKKALNALEGQRNKP